MNRWIKKKFLFAYKYTGKWISRAVNGKRSGARGPYRILLYCNASTMEEHLLNYMEQLEEEKYHFFVFLGDGYQKKSNLKSTLFSGKKADQLHYLWQMFCRRWDLIVSADLEHPFWMFPNTIPLLYIGHGISNVSYDQGKTVYDYGPECYDDKGQFLFDKMLEPNRRVAELLYKSDEKFRGVVCPTGYRFAGRIGKESEKSSFYRQKLGISDEKPVISFFGSWNRESLFHVLGENLFQVCDALKGTYTFIFSIHPREYKTYDKEINPMGEQVERQREKGHMVRSPGEDWIPYIMASDVVVSDYSTMMSLAILAGKKVMLSDFPDEKIGVYSLGYQVKKTFPVLKDASELEDALKQVLELPVFDQMVEQFRQELYVSVEDYQEKIRAVTKEMTDRR
ncbi:MAG: CDP-glycerol glycerophosphotransferase family protein [Lachnospiraceae bacterium]|nr:CDP-glycerol glycerophosphotransferase family protein [Lachnospiraceae bacterium]